MNEARKKSRSDRILSKHPFALGKYLVLNIVIYSIVTAGILFWNRLFETISWWWVLSLLPLFLNHFRYIIGGTLLLSMAVFATYTTEITWIYLLLFPASIYVGHLSAVLLHNAVHNIFRPSWLNPIIGEVCALHQISAGFPVFRLVHYQHHIHSDDPEKDPHPSLGYTFWSYIDVGRVLVMKRLKAIYFENWGDSEKSQNLWKTQEILLVCSRFVKTFFWFSLLGPKLFALVFVPSYISYIYLFASFNYFTHHEKDDGTIEILNLDNNWYFKFCNKTLFGVFYHKNHHLRPRLFNPMHFN